MTKVKQASTKLHSFYFIGEKHHCDGRQTQHILTLIYRSHGCTKITVDNKQQKELNTKAVEPISLSISEDVEQGESAEETNGSEDADDAEHPDTSQMINNSNDKCTINILRINVRCPFLGVSPFSLSDAEAVSKLITSARTGEF